MANLHEATTEDVQRLLELFPISALKGEWDSRGTKEELCRAIATTADRARIAGFLMKNFGRCKQHAYIFQPRTEDHPDPEVALPDVHPLGSLGDSDLFYLGLASFTVLLRDPDFRQETVGLLWPMRIQYKESSMVVSFIVLERDVRALFDGEVLNVRRHVEEKTVADSITSLGFQTLDLNKGVKSLWASDYMDAFRSKFKKARSTTTEAMDKDRGIKATDNELYELMQGRPMFETMFRVSASSDSAVEVFQINPTDGVVRMTRYTNREGDSDEVLERLLKANI